MPNLVESYVVPTTKEKQMNSLQLNKNKVELQDTDINKLLSNQLKFSNQNIQNYQINEINSDKINCRIYQKGAQKIIGFDFKASLTMDMTSSTIDNDTNDNNNNINKKISENKVLNFKLVESAMFSSFDGSWTLKCMSRTKEHNTMKNDFVYKYKTLLTYTVLVVPKGLVPVIALEWRYEQWCMYRRIYGCACMYVCVCI